MDEIGIAAPTDSAPNAPVSGPPANPQPYPDKYAGTQPAGTPTTSTARAPNYDWLSRAGGRPSRGFLAVAAVVIAGIAVVGFMLLGGTGGSSADGEKTAGTAYLDLVDQAAAVRSAQNSSADQSTEAVSRAVQAEMRILREGLPRIDWPDRSRPYAERLIAATAAMEAGAMQVEAGASFIALGAMTNALAEIRTSAALLRASLDLPPPPLNANGETTY